MSKNILLLPQFQTVSQIPPFKLIQVNQFTEAFEYSMKENNKEIDEIADNNNNNITFENTIVPLENSGKLLERTCNIFFNLDSSNTNDDIQAIARDFAPKLAAHSSKISLNSKIFNRVDKLYSQIKNGTVSYDNDQKRLVETTREKMIRSGVCLNEEGKKRMSEITSRQALLENQFAQNVLNDEKNWKLKLNEKNGETNGLPDFLLHSMKDSESNYVVTLGRSIVEPFLTFSTRRDLRKIVHDAFVTRGNHPTNATTTAAAATTTTIDATSIDKVDEKENNTNSNNNNSNNNNSTPALKNTEIIAELLSLRSEEANLLGFSSYGNFKLDNSMAKTPTEVHNLLNQVWEPAKAKIEIEKKMLLKEAIKDNISEIEAYDWRYYAEKVRKVQFDLDEEELKPYFELENMIKAVFYTAKQLFNVDYIERKDIPMYRDDVRVYECINLETNKIIGFFLHDNFTHENKRSGIT